MEALGLGELLTHRNLGEGHDPVTAYTIIAELKRELDSWKREFKALEEKSRAQDD
jgi:hypothetical protein